MSSSAPLTITKLGAEEERDEDERGRRDELGATRGLQHETGTCGASAAVGVRDRKPPILAERLRGDPHTRRRLPALVLREVDEADDPPHDGSSNPSSIRSAAVLSSSTYASRIGSSTS